MKIILIIFFLTLAFTSISFSQNFQGRIVIGKKYATQEIKKAIANKNFKPFYDTLINDKGMAIAIAEPILFKTYGNVNGNPEKVRAYKPYYDALEYKFNKNCFI